MTMPNSHKPKKIELPATISPDIGITFSQIENIINSTNMNPIDKAETTFKEKVNWILHDGENGLPFPQEGENAIILLFRQTLQAYDLSLRNKLVEEVERLKYIRPDQTYPITDYEKVRNGALEDVLTIIKKHE